MVGTILEMENTEVAERLDSLETHRERECKGYYFDTDTNTEYTAEFKYQEYSDTAVEILKKQNLSEDDREILERKYTELGLNDITFRCYSKDTEFKKDISSKNIYVLAHGWTGNKDIYSEVQMEGNLSVVEQILAMDPNAVIITPDGNGFGGSTFRQEISESKEFGKYCTAEAYAKQIDFLIKDVLKLDPSTITVAGHSMGGTLTYEMVAKLGYKNGIAIAPAAFPSEESLEYIKDKIKDSTLIEAAKKYNINLSTVLYSVISGSVKLGQGIRNIAGEKAQPLIDTIIGKVFEGLSPYLMGKEVSGIPEVDKKIIEQLVKIHSQEITPEKYKVIATALAKLGNGTNYTTWNEEELRKSSRVIAFAGTTDVLVQPPDYEVNEIALLAHSLGTSSEEQVAQTVKSNLDKPNKITGGHYAPVYNPKVISSIVKSGKKH